MFENKFSELLKQKDLSDSELKNNLSQMEDAIPTAARAQGMRKGNAIKDEFKREEEREARKAEEQRKYEEKRQAELDEMEANKARLKDKKKDEEDK